MEFRDAVSCLEANDGYVACCVDRMGVIALTTLPTIQ